MRTLTRKESQEATRAALREAAAREIARRGFAGTTIDSIAASAGFTRGAFYSNYATKFDLLLEVLEDIQREELQAWSEMISTAVSLDAMLAGLAERFDIYAARDSQVLLAAELRLEARRNPEFAEHYAVSTQRLLDLTMQMAALLTERARLPASFATPIALTVRAMAIGLEWDTEARSAGQLSPGSIMATVLRSMLQSAGGASAAEPIPQPR